MELFDEVPLLYCPLFYRKSTTSSHAHTLAHAFKSGRELWNFIHDLYQNRLSWFEYLCLLLVCWNVNNYCCRLFLMELYFYSEVDASVQE